MAKTKVPAYIEPADLDRLRNTVVGLQKHPDVLDPPISLSSFVADAIMAAVKEAERRYTQGRPFPARRRRDLPTGPRPGSADDSPVGPDCGA
ncbi:hypothetical protein [Streptomyces swartbergensis]|uniref:hypothetical protein n=1 Tax=Streptomyces swartbergensis TaxID=487165 RepID=UPI0011813353|nr:hypothetical protein [Streptomyces swartbergensis]